MAQTREPGRVPAGDAPALEVLEVGLACCALEAAAAGCRRGAPSPAPGGATPGTGDASEAGASKAPGAPSAAAVAAVDDGRPVLVIAGTVTNAMAAAIKARYDALGRPRVVAFGACATSGGPYWDSYAVTPGIDRVLPVDLVVPGCPPRPEAMRAALAELAAREDTTAEP